MPTRGDSSFFAHGYRGTLIAITAALLGVDQRGWCLLVIGACLVLIAELAHGAVDTLARAIGDPEEPRLRRRRDRRRRRPRRRIRLRGCDSDRSLLEIRRAAGREPLRPDADSASPESAGIGSSHRVRSRGQFFCAPSTELRKRRVP